jgi:hypothetical protein
VLETCVADFEIGEYTVSVAELLPAFPRVSTAVHVIVFVPTELGLYAPEHELVPEQIVVPSLEVAVTLATPLPSVAEHETVMLFPT